MSAWNAVLYLRNAGPRLKPALDLLQRSVLMLQSGPQPISPQNVSRVLDLGCGPGNITPYLREAFPNAKIVGIDSSEEMLSIADKKAVEIGNVEFQLGSIEKLLSGGKEDATEGYDVVYSNAALHWVPDHKTLFPALMRCLVGRGGVLAVQMPDTRTQPSHTLMLDACKKCGFANEVKHVRIPRVEKDPSYYYDILSGQFSDIEMWSTEYVQQLPSERDSPHPVLEYVRSTGLMPVLEALGPEKAQIVLTYYEDMLYDVYPNRFLNQKGDQNSVLFPFKRFFVVAKK